MSQQSPEPDMVKGCTLDALKAKGLVTLRLIGKPVGIFQGPDGAVVAREMSCKHQGADLSSGDRQGSVVTCPRHGWQYDLETGESLLPKGGASLREHPVVVRDGIVWVGIRPIPRSSDW